VKQNVSPNAREPLHDRILKRIVSLSVALVTVERALEVRSAPDAVPPVDLATTKFYRPRSVGRRR
jgi:hypothetical protein